MERNLPDPHKLSHIPCQILTTCASCKNKMIWTKYVKLATKKNRISVRILGGKRCPVRQKCAWEDTVT
jgi:hypothetical protein